MMPHQLMAAMIILGFALIVLVVFSALAIRFLMKLHQRVRRLEQELGVAGDPPDKSHTPH